MDDSTDSYNRRSNNKIRKGNIHLVVFLGEDAFYDRGSTSNVLSTSRTKPMLTSQTKTKIDS